MNTQREPSGSKILDKMLDGGYEKDVLTTIYGPAGSGKTVLCMLAAISVAKSGKKVVYIDTEGGFSVDRLVQITEKANIDFKKVLNNLLFLKPLTFEEQKESFEKLRKYANEDIGLIVLDTVAMLYRLELGQTSNVPKLNRELGSQLAFLTQIARQKNIPVLIANQVYADFEDKDKINMVGGDILKYQSKCLIELKLSHERKRKAVLRKHRSIAQEKSFSFEIVEGGILGTTSKKSFFSRKKI